MQRLREGNEFSMCKGQKGSQGDRSAVKEGEAKGDGSRLGPDRGAALGTTGCMIYGAWCKIKMQDPFYKKLLKI